MYNVPGIQQHRDSDKNSKMSRINMFRSCPRDAKNHVQTKSKHRSLTNKIQRATRPSASASFQARRTTRCKVVELSMLFLAAALLIKSLKFRTWVLVILPILSKPESKNFNYISKTAYCLALNQTKKTKGSSNFSLSTTFNMKKCHKTH